MHRAQITATIGIAVVALFVGAKYSPEGPLESRLAAAEATISSLERRLAAISDVELQQACDLQRVCEIASYMGVEYPVVPQSSASGGSSPAGLGLTTPKVFFEGVNVVIRSGAGSTDDGGTLSGLGNLIIGYNEYDPGALPAGARSGSHNLVVGKNHQYPSFGGFVAGQGNTIDGANASVTGGSNNTASGTASSVTGGFGNKAIGLQSSIAGGGGNDARAPLSSIAGGTGNEATGNGSHVGGGGGNLASGEGASVFGGTSGNAAGAFAKVSGGIGNTANGNFASVNGGNASEANGESSSVNGGSLNRAEGNNSTIGGGLLARTAAGLNDWVAGALFQDF